MNAEPSTPTVTELRNFGLLMGVFIAGIFGLLIPWIWDLTHVSWPWVLGSIFVGWALIAPTTLASVFKLWMKFGTVVGWINTRLILAIVFYLMFFPLGGIMRLFGWDAMHRKIDPGLYSYRITSKPIQRENMDQPF